MSAPTKPTRSETALARAAADLDATIAAHKAADSAQNIPEGNTIPSGNNLAATPAPAAMMEMPIAWIWPSTFNPRRTFDDTALRELADSILAHGMLEPIVVREREISPITLMHVTNADGETQPVYEVIAGERRYRAARLAKLDSVPVRILTGIDDTKALQLAILENLQRVDLDPIDEARGFAALRDQAGMTQAEIGAAVKRSQPVIAKSLALLKLPDDVLQLIQSGQLSASHGQALAKLGDFPKVIDVVAKWAVDTHATTRELERSPLGSSYELEQKSLVVRLAYGAAFDRAICDACPFGAKFGDGYNAYCLKPEHYSELQTAARKDAQRILNTQIQAIKRDGGTVLKLENLRGSDYCLREYQIPPTCTDACPCAAQALDGMGNLRPICTDRKRYEALKATHLKDEKKAKRETVKAQIEDLTNHLQQLDTVGAAQLAALILPQLRHVSKAAWEGAVAKHKAGHLTNKDAVTAAALAQLDPVDLIRFSLQAIIGHELLASIEESWRPMDAWKYYRTVILPAVEA